MTGRTTTLATEGATISKADLDRIAAEEQLHKEQQLKAARVIASCSIDADDARAMLEMLGLGPAVVAAARTPRPAGARRRSRAA